MTQQAKNPYQALLNIAFFCRVMGWIFVISTILAMIGGVYAFVVWIPSSSLSIELRGEIIRMVGFAIIVGVFSTMAWFGLGGILQLLIDLKNDVHKLIEQSPEQR